MLFGGARIYFDSPRFNFLFIALASILPWISLSWALVFNRGSWGKPTVIFSLYVIALSMAMVVLTWQNGGSDKVVNDKDSSVIELAQHDTEAGRIVIDDGITNSARSNIITVYKDKRLAPGLWLRSLVYTDQIYEVDHFVFSKNEVKIVTHGTVPETKKVPL